MKSAFLTTLDARLRDDRIWVIGSLLVYWSESFNALVLIPPWLDHDHARDWDEGSCYETDFASVPRIPFVYEAWGDRAHREAVLHDFVYCTDGKIYIYSDEAKGEEGYRHPLAKVIEIRTVTRAEADSLFLEAMESTGKPRKIRWPMYAGVRIGGGAHYHKRSITDGVK